MASVTINVNLVNALDSTIEASALAAYRIVTSVVSKEKLSDSKEKFVYVRAVRVLHTACEYLDRTSYRDLDEIEDKASDKSAYTRIKIAATKVTK